MRNADDRIWSLEVDIPRAREETADWEVQNKTAVK